MPHYLWKGIDTSGQNKKGSVFADSSEELKKILFSQKIALLEHKIKNKKSFSNLFFNKISLSQKVFFFEQLSILINSGVELMKSLKIIENQIKSNMFKNIVSQISNQIQSGTSFAEALKIQENIFPQTTINFIRAGENSGHLGLVLNKITHNLKAHLRLKKSIEQAALLPIITVIFALLITFGIFVFVIPQFETLFDSMEQKIPASTKTILNISAFLRSEKIIYVLCSILILMFLLKILLKTGPIKKITDKFLCNLIFINQAIILPDLISFLGTLSMFLKSGINLKQSLENAIPTIKNSYFRQKAFTIIDNIIDGESLENSMEKIGPPFFPRNLIAIISTGEQSDKLELSLGKATKILKDNLSSKLKTFVTIFQPILTIFIGLFILFILLSIYMPIFNLAKFV